MIVNVAELLEEIIVDDQEIELDIVVNNQNVILCDDKITIVLTKENKTRICSWLSWLLDQQKIDRS
jgi:hypothetical protein